MACISDGNMHQQLYSSLLLLGLDKEALEHSLHTPVNQNMFLRMNKKLGETLLHFLFMSIDPERAAKVFRDCWPIVERKQGMLFQKATFEWYKSLQQSYGQMVPSIVAKSFMAPTGPKFTSIVTTLVRIALHSSIAKKDPRCTILNCPVVCRCPKQNKDTFQLQQAFKYTHYKDYVDKQIHHQKVIKSLEVKSREALCRYRRLCSDCEKAGQELKEICQRNTSITKQHKDKLINMPFPEMEKEILQSIASMNALAEKKWQRFEEFQAREEASWNILDPLLSGTTHSYLDGAQYSPQVPDIIYKDHATTINKLKLEGGVYTGGQLNLVNLLNYSYLALTSLQHTITSTSSQPLEDLTGEVAVQQGQVESLGETSNELSARLAVLLPSLRQSVATTRRSFLTEHPAMQSLELDGKPLLYPPTPSMSLTSIPMASGKGDKNYQFIHHLTPGTSIPKLKMTKDKDYSLNRRTVVCNGPIVENVSEPSHSLTEPQCIPSPVSYIGISEEDEGNVGLGEDVLSADTRGRYQQQKEKKLEELHQSIHPHHSTYKKVPKTSGHIKKPVAVGKTKAPAVTREKEKDITVMPADPIINSNFKKTLPEKKLEKSVIMEEKFIIDSQSMSELLSQTDENKRSSLLPEESVFDTLTDSILLGESAVALLHQDEVQSEIRRESIASRRQSLASLGSFDSGKHIQDTQSIFMNTSQELGGILDQSDSCLFSTSMEDF
ncbi:hypothetical protein Pmani_023799 [Petrolisthes manimaculis]|uniref:HAUS augmin-like complex subunit 6 N-terminal domain-containing protein n=1 Tax=Petrolisthes manimaculis TaxID=1843537 RepID=A0AAE1P8U6_9EUCA|nr:hypothetical protein Pmani_023799 [Petrolisthes manimaculis]